MLKTALITVAIAATPVLELRAAIPFALYSGLSGLETFLLALFGNLVPVPFLAWLLPTAEKLARRTPGGTRFFTWWTHRTRRKITGLHTKWGIDLALILFVAVPLPGTGAWTGTLAGWLLGLAPGRIILDVSLGVILAAIIVLLASFGLIQLIWVPKSF